MTPGQFEEARRLHQAGLKLVELYASSKRPVGDGWNHKAVESVRPDAGGYGLLLAANGLCSVDVDSEERCREGLARCGFDLDVLRTQGVPTSSTRPGSGGRITFLAPPGSPLRWVKFSSCAHGTILELRAASPNLQDSLPGTVYYSQDGTGPWEQQYSDFLTLDMACEPPADLLVWWERLSTDVEYLREQQTLFVGETAQLAVSSGDGKLAYSSACRAAFNEQHSVTDILEAHGYSLHRNGRYAPPTATGAAAVRPIPGRDDLWQSDHASDPLHGTFDAWTAHVVLAHGGRLEDAERAQQVTRALTAVDGFDDEPVPVRVEGTGGPVDQEPEPLPNFDRDKSGKIKPTILNLLMALRREDVAGVRVGLDGFRDEIMLALPGSEQWRPFGDADYVWLRAHLETGSNGFGPISKEMMRDVVQAVASEHAFDSAILWLNSLQDDGGSRCETFLIDYFGAEDTPYVRAVSLYLWTALAGRVLSPGCKADMVPILVGEQGLGKSTAIGALVPSPDFFAEVSFAEKDDDLARKMRGKLIAEIGELRGLHTKELEAIKAFITRTHEQWVPKFREFTTMFPRRLVFVGSTNKDQFLADETGHRRWLPVRVSQVAVDRVRQVAPLCWAEARRLFLAGGVQWAAAERLARQVHDEFAFHDSWEEAVQQWLKGPLFGEDVPTLREFATTTEALVGAIGIDQKAIARKDEMRMAAVFRKLGYSRKKVRISNGTKWAFVPTDPTLRIVG
ncbi:DNA primase [Acidovorax phage ACF1]|nr:DNA primase [Acidovorax phage ACF1]